MDTRTKTPGKTSTERQRFYRQRMRELGKKKVTLWLTEDEEKKVRQFMLDELFSAALKNQGFNNFDELNEAALRTPQTPDTAAFSEHMNDPASAPLQQ